MDAQATLCLISCCMFTILTSRHISLGGEHRNESIFASSSTVKHASHTDKHLLEHYTSDIVDQRVECFYADDYDNEYLELTRLPIGEAQSYYQKNNRAAS